MGWLFYACVSAVAAAFTAILAKLGVGDVPSTLATAVRTAVVVACVWVITIGVGEHRMIGALPRRSLLFLCLSGLGTGVSWLAYFRALQLGPASRVVPIDKLSLPLTIVMAAIWLGEPISLRVAVGVALMTAGALLTVS